MAVPVATAIRRRYESSFITWAVDSRCSAVVDTDRLVDLRYEIPRVDWKKKSVSWIEQYRHFARLRAFRFDYGLDLQGHSKTALCLKIANPRKRVSSRATDVLSHLLNPVAPKTGPLKHTVERNLEVLGLLDDFPTECSPIMPDVCPFLDRLNEDLPSSSELVTISVSAGHVRKRYSIEGWTEVAGRMIDLGYNVAFLGGAGDPEPRVPGAINWVGKLSLAESMAAVAKSTLHLASDTGTGHIAAAYRVPVISVFGYTRSVEYRPYSENAIVLDAGRSMKGVTPAQILDAVEQIRERRPHAILS